MTKKTCIIFDVNGVLLKERKYRLLKKIGIKNLLNYFIRHRKSPLHACLLTMKAMYEQEIDLALSDATLLSTSTIKSETTLEKTSEKIMFYKNHPMPKCVIDWQRGYISNNELLTQLTLEIEQLSQDDHFKSVQEKKLVIRILKTILNVRYLMAISKPIRSSIKLVKSLKRKKYRLFILSNLGSEYRTFLEEQYADILKLFDGSVFSCDAHVIKPEPEIYHYFLEKYQIQAHECIFIDDQEENITAARNLGIESIRFTHSTAVKKQLKKLLSVQ